MAQWNRAPMMSSKQLREGHVSSPDTLKETIQDLTYCAHFTPLWVIAAENRDVVSNEPE